MVWTKACDLEAQCKELLESFSNLSLHREDKMWTGKLLTTYKNLMFYHLLYHHCQPLFHLDNAKGKHDQISQLQSHYQLLYQSKHMIHFSQDNCHLRHFAQNIIISKDKDAWPKEAPFLDEFEIILNGTVKCHTLQNCSTMTLYYISLPSQEVHSNNVMSAFITLSMQISDKLASS